MELKGIKKLKEKQKILYIPAVGSPEYDIPRLFAGSWAGQGSQIPQECIPAQCCSPEIWDPQLSQHPTITSLRRLHEAIGSWM